LAIKHRNKAEEISSLLLWC